MRAPLTLGEFALTSNKAAIAVLFVVCTVVGLLTALAFGAVAIGQVAGEYLPNWAAVTAVVLAWMAWSALALASIWRLLTR